jgi:PAS domain S-box-containing protein
MSAAADPGTRPSGHAFLAHGGELGALIAAHDWAATPLGPIESWPQSLRTAVGIVLHSAVAIVMLWGEDGTMIYNDSYAVFAGGRHPGALGMKVREAWPEVAAFNDSVMKTCLAGGTLAYRDQELMLYRPGRVAQTWMDLDYSPVLDESGRPAGVIAIVTETTDRVLAERAQAAAETRVSTVLDSIAEGFLLLDRDYRVTTINAGGLRLETRPAEAIVGLTQWEAWPGSEHSSLGALYRRVMDSRVAESLVHYYAWPDGRDAWIEVRVYPSGDGLALFYRDVTERKRAEDRKSALLVLGDRLRAAKQPDRIAALAGAAIGETLGIAQAAYAVIGGDGDAATVLRPWLRDDTIVSLEGAQRLSAWGDYGGCLHGGTAVVVEDTGADALTRGGKALFARIGRMVGMLLVTDDRARAWRAEDLAFLSGVADRTWAALQIAAAEAGLLALNLDLERQVRERTRERDRVWVNSRDLLVIVGADGIFRAANPAWQAVLGYAPHEVVGRDHRHFVLPADGAASQGALRDAAAHRDLTNFENRYRHRDGGMRWISWNTSVEDGLVYAYGRDVTDERAQAAELERSRASLRSVFETSFQLQALLSPDGIVLDANAVSLAAIDQALDQVVGRAFWDTPWFSLTPGVPERVRAAVTAAAGGETVSLSLTTHVARGPRSYDFSLRPIRDAAGQVVAVVPEAVDTTERLDAEEKLRQSQKMEAVGQLTGGLAHDFNNLLTGVTGSLELLQTRLAQGRTGELERYIVAAQGAARRAAALTHRLLAFSRRQTLDPQPTDVNALVAGMEELIRRTAGPEVAVEVVGAGGLWTTLVDPNQLENALLNLCINARDAMPDGGRLTIETGNKWLDERAARERELPAGQYVTLCVSDTGTGMTPEVARRAFDPFYTTKPIGLGTGLGLSMIYGFVRQSGGQARIYSEPGHGAMVCLYLPRHFGPAEAGEAPPAPARPGADGRGQTVLVVDDEPTVRMLVAEVLEDLGYTALEAGDGAAGLAVLRSDARVDLLITDVGLPGGMNGRQVADAGRAMRPGLRVLFITGYADNAVVGHGHLEPGMHVLTKPFAMDGLASRIRDLLAAG